MRTFGQVFGFVVGLFGILFDFADVVGFYELINTSPLPDNTFEIGLALAFIFVIGTLMVIGGFYVFVQSRKP